MTAFARASAILFANTDMAEAVTFSPATGDDVDTRAVFQEPTQDVSLYGQTLRLGSLVAWLPATAATPAKGDSILRGATTYVINAAPELDNQATAWRCPLDPAGTP